MKLINNDQQNPSAVAGGKQSYEIVEGYLHCNVGCVWLLPVHSLSR